MNERNSYTSGMCCICNNYSKFINKEHIIPSKINLTTQIREKGSYGILGYSRIICKDCNSEAGSRYGYSIYELVKILFLDITNFGGKKTVITSPGFDGVLNCDYSRVDENKNHIDISNKNNNPNNIFLFTDHLKSLRDKWTVNLSVKLTNKEGKYFWTDLYFCLFHYSYLIYKSFEKKIGNYRFISANFPLDILYSMEYIRFILYNRILQKRTRFLFNWMDASKFSKNYIASKEDEYVKGWIVRFDKFNAFTIIMKDKRILYYNLFFKERDKIKKISFNFWPEFFTPYSFQCSLPPVLINKIKL